MSNLLRALLGLTLLLLSTLALAPTASAVACSFGDPGAGGLVGRTWEYAANVGEAACRETFSYYGYVCTTVLGPSPSCYPR